MRTEGGNCQGIRPAGLASETTRIPPCTTPAWMLAPCTVPLSSLLDPNS